MVVVVPTFPEGDQRERERVAGIIAGFEATGAHHVGEGIDEERAVEEHEGADEEAPDEQLRPGSAKPRSDNDVALVGTSS